MPAPDSVKQLVDRFGYLLPSLKRPNYNETEVRTEFIDHLFIALGWDVHNSQGYSNAYKDVQLVPELGSGGAPKFPDYAFRLGGVRKFFLEAKKPSIDIRNEPSPAYQVRRYAWTAKLPLSILTDFEEFAVYDCRIKPNKDDSAAVARTLYMRYTDYVDRWDEIASIFGRESILKGSFDAYVESNKAKKGTTEVDQAFLAEISRWREELARNIALRNPAISTRELNFAVQQTIDRILFLRICEDRGLEIYGVLGGLANGSHTYARMVQEFQRADSKYNSGLFHFRAEKEQAGDPDTLTPTLSIDDKVLKEILKKLYYPDSPYEFSVLPADILGQVYEQFLGKVIRLTAGHQAKVEEKPEVKKAGGVYYTPTYIVDYIVRQTVGKLVEGKRPGPRGGVSKLRVVDPACGSGSFLIGAYQFLLDWHLEQYTSDNPEQWATKSNPQLYRTDKGEWRLTIDERKRILTKNIYGVDIDPQAVEVTKLSLLLKVLEGESMATLDPQIAFFPDRVLPDLAKNIRCGNSLIGPDFYATRQLGLLDEDEALRINVFDWQAAFPDVFAEGGFDAVIGNPPYIRIQAMKEWAPVEVEFYKKRYKSASKGNYDIYVVFVERGLSLLRQSGLLGYILPHKFFNAQYGEPLRGLISDASALKAVVHFGDQQVFGTATTYTCLLFLSSSQQSELSFTEVTDLSRWSRDAGAAHVAAVESTRLTGAEWVFSVGLAGDLIERLRSVGRPLRSLMRHMFQGLVTSADPVYFLEPLGEEMDGHIHIRSSATGREYWLETGVVKPLCKGSVDIRRYHLGSSKRVVFPYDVERSQSSGKTLLIPPDTFSEKWPATWAYLQENYQILRDRERGKMRHAGWYGYVYPKSVTLFDRVKILTPSIAAHASFTYDAAGSYYFAGSGGGGGGGYGLITADDLGIDPRYIVGLLNSAPVDFVLRAISSRFRGGYYAYSRQYVESLPIYWPDVKSPSQRIAHDAIVAHVQSMLDLHAKLAAATVPDMKVRYRSQIAIADRQIDELVYELYGLSDKEIAIVEGGAPAEEPA